MRSVGRASCTVVASVTAVSDYPTGWAFPGNARKAHWFGEDGRSLCGKWANYGLPAEAHEEDSGPSKDDCVGCRRRLDQGHVEAGYDRRTIPKPPARGVEHEAIVTDAFNPIAWCSRCWERWPCPAARAEGKT